MHPGTPLCARRLCSSLGQTVYGGVILGNRHSLQIGIIRMAANKSCLFCQCQLCIEFSERPLSFLTFTDIDLHVDDAHDGACCIAYRRRIGDQWNPSAIHSLENGLASSHRPPLLQSDLGRTISELHPFAVGVIETGKVAPLVLTEFGPYPPQIDDELRERLFGNRHHDYRFDYRIIRDDGEIRWIESRACISYDEDGQPQQVIGINIDDTERKQTEAHLSDALAAGQVVAFEWDAVTGRSQRSDNAEQILGIVQDGGFLRQVHPADRGNFNDLIRNISAGNPSYTLTFRFARADGRDV